jgi:voltage-gated potassium channel
VNKQRTLDKHYLSRKEKWREIIFDANTPDARLFDVVLLWFILVSVFVVMLSSVPTIPDTYSVWLKSIEWFFTIVFSIEYFLRIYLSEKPRNYIFSFWGIIDLLSTIPTYLSIFVAGPQYLLTIRTLRLLRVFRIMRITSYSKEARSLVKALRASGAKVTVFFGFILIIVIIMGTIMFIVEGPENGFTSIPRGIYWAIVTVTTVGYGDITPNTILGQVLSSTLMILGYAVITVPTGIVSVEYADQKRKRNDCNECGTENDNDANFCKECGADLSLE